MLIYFPSSYSLYRINHTAPVMHSNTFPPQIPGVRTIFRVTNALPCAFSIALSCLLKCCDVEVDFQISHIFSRVSQCFSILGCFFSPLPGTSDLLLCILKAAVVQGRVPLKHHQCSYTRAKCEEARIVVTGA